MNLELQLPDAECHIAHGAEDESAAARRCAGGVRVIRWLRTQDRMGGRWVGQNHTGGKGGVARERGSDGRGSEGVRGLGPKPVEAGGIETRPDAAPNEEG